MASPVDILKGSGPAIFADRPDYQRKKNFQNHPYQIMIQSQLDDREEIQVHGWLPEQITFDVSSQYEAPYSQGLNNYMPFIGSVARAMGVNLVTQAMTIQVWQGSSELNFTIPIVFQAETDAYRQVIKPITDLLRLVMPRDPQRGGLLQAPGPHISIEKLRKKVGSSMNGDLPTVGPQSGHNSPPSTNGYTAGRFLEDTATETKKLFGDVVSSGADIIKNLSGSLQDFGSTSFNTIASTISNKGIDLIEGLQKGTSAALTELNRSIVNAIDNNISLYVGDFLYFPSVVITDVSQAYDILLAPDNNPSRATVNVNFRTFYIPTESDIEQMFSSVQSDVSRNASGSFSGLRGASRLSQSE